MQQEVEDGHITSADKKHLSGVSCVKWHNALGDIIWGTFNGIGVGEEARWEGRGSHTFRGDDGCQLSLLW